MSSTDDASARYSRCRLTGKLDEPGEERRDDCQHEREHEDDHLETPAAAVPVARGAATPAEASPEGEAQEEVGQKRDRPDENADEERVADVVVAHVRQLVADHALELFAVELLQEPRRDRDRGMPRIAARGEAFGAVSSIR